MSRVNREGAPPFIFLAIIFSAFLAATLLVCALTPLRKVLDQESVSTSVPLDIPVLGRKMENFLKNKDQYSVLFLGASATFREIIPEVFDREMAALGMPVKSFNFGLSGESVEEAEYILKEILRSKPSRLKWVFLDTSLSAGALWKENLQTPRFVYWHTFNETWFISRYLLFHDVNGAAGSGAFRKMKLILDHWRACYERLFGMVPSAGWLRRRVELVQEADSRCLDENEGYCGVEMEGGEIFQIRRNEFIRRKDRYVEEISRRMRDPKKRTGTGGTAYKSAVFRKIEDMLAEKKIQTILLTPPYLNADGGWAGDGEAMSLDFSSVSEYPDLFSFENRFDAGHLNETMAATFSRLVARRFSKQGSPIP